MNLLYILLAIIAYFLWRIYKQKEDENQEITEQKLDIELEAKRKEEFKDYPHLIEKISYTWLDVFGKCYVANDISFINAAFLIYLKEANNTKLDIIEVDWLFDSLWDLTEELLEHLEKYHESTKYEYEIAIITFWQLVAEKAECFIGKDFETIQKIFQSAPFTDIEKIISWFPKKDNHPNKELSFRDEKGNFPRKSKGSKIVHARITV